MGRMMVTLKNGRTGMIDDAEYNPESMKQFGGGAIPVSEALPGGGYQQSQQTMQTQQKLPGQTTQTQSSTGFDWSNNNLVQQKRVQAIQAGVKPTEVDNYIKQKQTDYATLQLAQKGELDDKDWQKIKTSNPMLALQIQQSGKSPLAETPITKAKKLKDLLLSEVKEKAKSVKEILALGKAGKLTGEQYDTALGQAVSDFNKQVLFSKEDKVAGSALTAVELAQLAGGIVGVDSRKPNWYDNIVGIQPAPQPKVKDSESVINQKMDYILTGKPPKGNAKKDGLNIGGDLKNILNSVLNLPAQSMETGNKIRSGDINAIQDLMPTNTLYNMVKGYGQSLNDDLGRPLEGGDIVGKIGENFKERPVSTTLDALPFLGGGLSKLLKGGNTTKALPGVTSTNRVQKGITRMVDATSGAGSKDYVARQATKADGGLPQNQALLDEGIVGRRTSTGKIQGTAQALNKYGKQIETVYKDSNIAYRGKQIDDLLNTGLKEMGHDPKAIAFIKRYIGDQGTFDMVSQDSVIHIEQVWKAAQKLENAPPKMLKNPESALAYKQLAKDTARILRKDMVEKVPQVKELNDHYSAFSDYKDNILPGISSGEEGFKGGIFQTATREGNKALNQVLQAGSWLNKIIRDNRYKQGNFTPRK